MNVIENATDALGNGRVERQLTPAVTRDTTTAVLRITDDGPGIPARHHGDISKTAEDIGMYRQQLHQKLTELGMDVERLRRRDDQ